MPAPWIVILKQATTVGALRIYRGLLKGPTSTAPVEMRRTKASNTKLYLNAVGCDDGRWIELPCQFVRFFVLVSSLSAYSFQV
jgi:hypothetical protein